MSTIETIASIVGGIGGIAAVAIVVGKALRRAGRDYTPVLNPSPTCEYVNHALPYYEPCTVPADRLVTVVQPHRDRGEIRRSMRSCHDHDHEVRNVLQLRSPGIDANQPVRFEISAP